jgi:simple sugar transport system permease protein
MDQYSARINLVIQALVILFTGALDNMVRMPLERIFLALRKEGN